MSNATNLVPCPLGKDCRSDSVNGHIPGSQQLLECQRAAAAATVERGGFDPNAVYEYKTPSMQRLVRSIKLAVGSMGMGIPNLIGPPGIGKTEAVAEFARSIGGEMLVFDVSSVDPDLFNGIPYKPDSSQQDGDEVNGRILKMNTGRRDVMEAGRLYEREIIEMFYRDPDAPPLVVFLDEINGGRPAVMSSLQKVLTGRVLPQEGKKLNDNVFFVAAMNDAEQTSNGSELAPAMISRLTPIHFKPNFEEWANGEFTFWGKGYDAERAARVANSLGLKPPTADDHLKAASYIIGFLNEAGMSKDASGMNLFNQPVPEDDPTRKIAQPRSWSKAIQSMALAIANSEPNSDEFDRIANIVTDQCGEQAGQAFATYFNHARELPDIKVALSKGEFDKKDVDAWKESGRMDIAFYLAHSLANRTFDGEDPVADRVAAFRLYVQAGEAFPNPMASNLPKAFTKWNAGLEGEDRARLSSEAMKIFAEMRADKEGRYRKFFDAAQSASGFSSLAASSMSGGDKVTIDGVARKVAIDAAQRAAESSN